MAEVRPFRAWRYDFDRLGEALAARLAPPYDLLDQTDKDRLLAGSDRNIVAIDLPWAPASELGPAECYESAARTFSAWCRDGTFVREASPAVYVYHQLFEYGGRRYTRRMFIARLRLEPFSEGTVLPHEETFGGPKEDRLALMKATGANLSPVFGLYRDPADDVAAVFAANVERRPDAVATLGGIENRVWIVTDGGAIDQLGRAFADKRVYIADGHHRYNTALNYRDWVAQERGGELPDDDPACFAMLVLASMDDPGCLILPTHRVLVAMRETRLDSLLDTWADGCSLCPPDAADLTLYEGDSGREQHVRFTNRAILSTLEPGFSTAWAALDLAYLHRYLIDELLTRTLPGGNGPDIRYVKSDVQARRIADDEHGIALICKPATMAQLRAVSEAGDLMPHKSTYFYPKVVTGLAINPLDEAPGARPH